jgi:hypothetical protein
MHIHTVFFWLRKSASEDERKRLRDGLDLLVSDEHIREPTIGVAAATDRPVIDSSYDYAIILKFDDLAAHDAYQAGAAHQQFLKDCADLWSRVQVYDIET